MAADAIKQKDDRAVFESLALAALNHHEKDPEFQRLLLHSALEKHELAEIFFDKFVRRVYEFLGAYIRERQREGALIEIDPADRGALLHRHGDAPVAQQQSLGSIAAITEHLE